MLTFTATHTMPSPPVDTTTPAPNLHGLDSARDQIQDVKAAVAVYAEDLGLANDPGREAVARFASLVRRACESPIDLGMPQFVIAPSSGIALYPAHGASGQMLVAQDTAAMYRGMQLRSHFEFFVRALASRRQADWIA